MKFTNNFFLFLLKAAEWFKKSEFSRLLDSFNKKIKEEHDQAVSLINEYIDIITHRGYTEGLLKIEDVQQSQDIMEGKLDIIYKDFGQRFTDLETNVDDMRKEYRFLVDDLGKERLQMLRIGENMLRQFSKFVNATNWEQSGMYF